MKYQEALAKASHALLLLCQGENPHPFILDSWRLFCEKSGRHQVPLHTLGCTFGEADTALLARNLSDIIGALAKPSRAATIQDKFVMVSSTLLDLGYTET